MKLVCLMLAAFTIGSLSCAMLDETLSAKADRINKVLDDNLPESPVKYILIAGVSAIGGVLTILATKVGIKVSNADREVKLVLPISKENQETLPTKKNVP